MRQYQENSFSDWLIFGEIVPTLKGVVWPYYLLGDNEKESENNNGNEKFNNADEFRNSIVYLQEAFAIESENVKSGYGLFTESYYYSKSNNLRQKALTESTKVSLKGLKSIDEKLAKAYETKFIKGLEMYFKGLQNQNQETIEKSSKLLNEFGAIYRDWVE